MGPEGRLSPPVGGAPSFPVQSLVPGASVAASYSTGAISIGAVGTVSYRDGANVYAFGHELDGAGRRSLFLQDAYVYGLIANPSAAADGSYKLAAPGHVEGTLTSDNPTDVIGVVGAPPPSTRWTYGPATSTPGRRSPSAPASPARPTSARRSATCSMRWPGGGRPGGDADLRRTTPTTLRATFVAASRGRPGRARHVYRDPSLLITGNATLFLDVRRPRRP